jgi:hypothetical protein
MYKCHAYAALDIARRILHELAKLSGEIRQLRRIVEKQTSTRMRSTSAENAIPEIADGPVNSIEDCRSVLSSCGEKNTQDFLVSFSFFACFGCSCALECYK